MYMTDFCNKLSDTPDDVVEIRERFAAIVAHEAEAIPQIAPQYANAVGELCLQTVIEVLEDKDFDRLARDSENLYKIGAEAVLNTVSMEEAECRKLIKDKSAETNWQKFGRMINRHRKPRIDDRPETTEGIFSAWESVFKADVAARSPEELAKQAKKAVVQILPEKFPHKD